MSDARALWRHEIPVDDAWHEFALSGPIVSVGCREVETVEFWAWHVPGEKLWSYDLRVFCTGEPFPAGPEPHPARRYCHIGTAVAPGGVLVWHLIDGMSWPGWQDSRSGSKRAASVGREGRRT